MKIVWAREDLPFGEKSIFLAGPTPRDFWVSSWRPEALSILADVGFKGSVIVPEEKNHGKCKLTNEQKQHQMRWERKGLILCDAVVFWVPRRMDTMPGLTTNIEFGWMVTSYPDKVFFGAPENAQHVGYMKDFLDEMGLTDYNNLKEMLRDVHFSLIDWGEETWD